MAPSLVLLGVAVASLALAIALAPTRVSRRSLFVKGVTALLAMAAMSFAPSLDLVVLILIAVAILHAGLGPAGAVATRLQAPVVAVALLTLTLVFVRVEGPEMLGRFASIGLVTGVAAAVGLLPYIHPLEPEEGRTEAAFIWLGFVGPVLAATVLLRARELIPADSGGYLGSVLIGIGLLNVLWGTVAAWLTVRERAAWHYSFMSDWGLALCGFGLTIADGRSAAVLLLVAILLGRFPLLMASRDASDRDAVDKGELGGRLVNVLAAAVLAGAAPFTGFAARVLLLRGATQIFWPLAIVLALGMLAWLPASLRLGRSVGPLRGRQAVALGLVLAANVAAGLYPLPLLSLGQL